MRSPLVAAALVALAGCGGSESSSTAPDGGDSSTTADVSSADSRIDPTSKCYFTGDVIVDGVTRSIRSSGCGIGSTNVGVVQVGYGEQQGAERLQVTFYFDEPVAPRYTGPIRVQDVKVSIGTSTTSRKWIGTSCTLAITRTESDPVAADASVGDGAADGGAAAWHLRAWGSGSCSAPFTPEAATTGTLTIGAFELKFESTRGPS